MIEWVSEEQATELKLNREPTSKRAEVCPFCSKGFDTHNAYTAHLRWHSGEIDDMVYNIIVNSSNPIRLATIQRLSGANFSVKNAVQRLNRSGKVHHVGDGFTTRLTAPLKAPVKANETFELPKVVAESISEDKMNKLIVTNLKRLQPEVYNSIVNEIIESMVRYALGMAEIS